MLFCLPQSSASCGSLEPSQVSGRLLICTQSPRVWNMSKQINQHQFFNQHWPVKPSKPPILDPLHFPCSLPFFSRPKQLADWDDPCVERCWFHEQNPSSFWDWWIDGWFDQVLMKVGCFKTPSFALDQSVWPYSADKHKPPGSQNMTHDTLPLQHPRKRTTHRL